LQYEQTGRWDYNLILKPDSPLQSNELGINNVYFTRLIDDIQMSYVYQFQVDQPVDRAVFLYQVDATLGAQGLWQRDYVLIPQTSVDGSNLIELSFLLPIDDYKDLLEDLRSATLATMDTPQLTINFRVRPQVNTAYGTITDPFVHSLNLQFDEELLQISGDLAENQTGEIDQTSQVAAAGVQPVRVVSGVGALLAALVFLYALRVYRMNWLPASAGEQELQVAQKHLKGLLVQLEELPPLRPEQQVMRLASMADMINLSDQTLRPVMYSQDGRDGLYHYCLIDSLGMLRYEYRSGVAGVGAPVPAGPVQEEQ
jgi:hypothetical protein